MITLKNLWEDFVTEIINEDLPKNTLEYERMFYASIFFFIRSLQSDIAKKEIKEDVLSLENIYNEALQYFETLLKEGRL